MVRYPQFMVILFEVLLPSFKAGVANAGKSCAITSLGHNGGGRRFPGYAGWY